MAERHANAWGFVGVGFALFFGIPSYLGYFNARVDPKTGKAMDAPWWAVPGMVLGAGCLTAGVLMFSWPLLTRFGRWIRRAVRAGRVRLGRWILGSERPPEPQPPLLRPAPSAARSQESAGAWIPPITIGQLEGHLKEINRVMEEQGFPNPRLSARQANDEDLQRLAPIAMQLDVIKGLIVEGQLLQGLAPAEGVTPSGPFMVRLSVWHTKINDALAGRSDLHALVDDAAVLDPPLPRWHARVIEAQMNALGGIVNALRRQHGL